MTIEYNSQNIKWHNFNIHTNLYVGKVVCVLQLKKQEIIITINNLCFNAVHT